MLGWEGIIKFKNTKVAISIQSVTDCVALISIFYWMIFKVKGLDTNSRKDDKLLENCLWCDSKTENKSNTAGIFLFFSYFILSTGLDFIQNFHTSNV
jgi:hypothetical protein